MVKVTILQVEARFFEKRGVVGHEVLNEVFEIEGVTESEVFKEDGDMRAEWEATLMTFAGITPDEFKSYDYVTYTSREIERTWIEQGEE